MRQRSTQRLPDTATIKRREQTGTNGIGEPLYGTTTVAQAVPCRFDDESTSFVREDSGERVQRPATVTFGPSVDVEEGDTVSIDGVATEWEVRGVNPTRDKRRDRVVDIVVELERGN